MRAVISSEWLKLRSVASTYYALGAAGLMVVLGVVWSVYASGLADERGSVRAAAPEEGFLPLVQISLAVIGVLAITAEHATGMIRTSLTVVPRRGVLLFAKTAVVTVVTFAAATAIIMTTYAVSRLLAGERRLGFNESSFAEDVPTLLAAGLSVTVLAIVGLGLGAAVRSTAGALVSVVSLLFVLPGIANYLPAPWNTRIAAFMLPNLTPQLTGERLSRRLGDGILPPWAALLALLAYAAVALGAGLHMLSKRDA
ncbi:ABC transporter permease [Nonomuraea roseoviolacea]|uniref:ABC transporter permease n=1 Tax=Nonomuraea roseoviolacea TaxID=103837 RepID=UPI002646F9E7|nr:ABC transporter permease [Nonomuraea roseoviolacea]